MLKRIVVLCAVVLLLSGPSWGAGEPAEEGMLEGLETPAEQPVDINPIICNASGFDARKRVIRSTVSGGSLQEIGSKLISMDNRWAILRCMNTAAVSGKNDEAGQARPARSSERMQTGEMFCRAEIAGSEETPDATTNIGVNGKTLHEVSSGLTGKGWQQLRCIDRATDTWSRQK